MPSNKHLLDNIRKKPESHKNAIAAIFALVPALLVGYAQFYMNANIPKEDNVSSGIVKNSDIDNVSAIASISKIFSESKDSIKDAAFSLKKIDREILLKDSETIKTQDSTNTMASTSVIIDENNIINNTSNN